MWDFELLDLVGVREKELMGLVLASLFKADGKVTRDGMPPSF